MALATVNKNEKSISVKSALKERSAYDFENTKYQAKLNALKKHIDELRNTLKDVYEFSGNDDMIDDLIKNRSDDRILGICLQKKSEFKDVIDEIDENYIFNYLKDLRVYPINCKGSLKKE